MIQFSKGKIQEFCQRAIEALERADYKEAAFYITCADVIIQDTFTPEPEKSFAFAPEPEKE